MPTCTACARPIDTSAGGEAIRSDQGVYHIACAPSALIASALEEYEAILRKGVRYFVEKYAASADRPPDIGVTFLELGRAVAREKDRRDRA